MAGSTTARGYGAAHKAERKRLAPTVAKGQTPCARCGQLIEVGEPWDLGHTDDRTGWTGPEHADCNRAAGARTRNARARARKQVDERPWIRPERQW